MAEIFFATLRAELIDHEHRSSRTTATKSSGEYIDNFYKLERRYLPQAQGQRRAAITARPRTQPE